MLLKLLTASSMLIFLVVPSSSFATAIGVNWSGDVYTIDETTGSGSFLGASGFTGLNSAAVDSTGDVFSSTGNSLITIDATTGIGTNVVTYSAPPSNGIRGLAFGFGDILYAIVDTGPSGSLGGLAGGIQTLEFDANGTLFGGRDALYTMNTGSGAWSLVGSGGYSDVRGLAIIKASVPEPGTLVLIGLGLVGIGFARRR